MTGQCFANKSEYQTLDGNVVFSQFSIGLRMWLMFVHWHLYKCSLLLISDHFPWLCGSWRPYRSTVCMGFHIIHTARCLGSPNIACTCLSLVSRLLSFLCCPGAQTFSIFFWAHVGPHNVLITYRRIHNTWQSLKQSRWKVLNVFVRQW